MNFVNTDLQKNNNKLDMKVDMNSSAFQKILDMISNSNLYKKNFCKCFIWKNKILNISLLEKLRDAIGELNAISDKE